MDIQILSTDSTEYTDSVTLTVGRHTYYVGFGKKWPEVNVLQCNASHRAYRKLGKYFRTWEQAISAYKSSEARTAIETAREWITAPVAA